MLLRPLSAALLLTLPFSLFAEEAALPLDDLIITATRTAQTADETLASVTVITQKDLQRLQARSLQDALRGVPGISISNNGGAGMATSIFMRGAESDQVLVLIDGVKVGSTTLGTTAFQDLPITLIDRIEVVRGPRASLYGSEAIGGVIQIFTRKGDVTLKPNFSIGGGSDETVEATAGLSAGSEQSWFSANVTGFNTQGFNACDSDGSGGCYTIEPDKDGHQNLGGTLRTGWRFANGAEADFHWLRTNSETEFDSSFSNEAENELQALGSSLRFSPMHNWQMNLAAGQSQDNSENFLGNAFISQYDTTRNSVSWQNDISLGTEHLVTAGFDWQDDQIDSTDNYFVDSRDNKALFTQYQGTFGDYDVQASLRNDDNEQFGNHATGNLAAGYALSDTLRFMASYGTAFKAPTFNELYYPEFGNPNLSPEKSRSFELGLAGELEKSHWSVNAFETHIEDLVGFDANFSPVNIDKTRILGVETILGFSIRQWEINTGLTLLDPENQSTGSNHGNELPRRAEQSLRIDVDRNFHNLPNIRCGATLQAENKRYDDLANTAQMGGYATVDIRGEFAFSKEWLAQARVANLFDKAYETADFYNQQDRSLFVTLRYQP